MLVPLAVAGFTALWLLAAFYSGRQCSWMAVVGAVDILWVMGMARPAPPARRAVAATTATLLMILATHWILAATYSGTQVGLSPWDASLRLGLEHALTLAALANDWRDAVWLLLALAVAAGGPFLSARLRAASAR
ncbi:hypothetical protein [Lysobacter sp. N42]|uniref:hypothetical protein n=1 Tax=Lysobacter sp. N42 TaxID=2545719 RepID=UPI0014055696|nr:hypothetical protein [Lysobacter sp. N42]